MDISNQEQQIIKYWKREKIFEKSLQKTKKGKPFVFFEGPPTANGKPGIHHILARSFKDVILRYQTMKGRYVLRKAGWDTHGLPVEIEVEKKLGLKNKPEIERYGIDKFNQEAKKSVWSYKKEWEDLTERMGFWLDMKNPYVTYDNSYIETLWWIMKEIWKKGLLYKGFKVSPRCTRCDTTLSSHELALGYKEITETSIYVKFALEDSLGSEASKSITYFLVWTTTPWTLPANVALAVNPNIIYIKVKEYNQQKSQDEYWILSKNAYGRLQKKYQLGMAFDVGLGNKIPVSERGQIIWRKKGKDLLGWKYRPLFDFVKPDKDAFMVIAGDFVGEKEGTGIVHIAPAFGEDDLRVAQENNLPILQTVNEDGTFKQEIKPWAGLFVKDADSAIINELNRKGLLFKTESYSHDYPYCWRCDTPLIYYAKDSWFIKMTALKRQLIKNNQKINWVPTHLKEGRFGSWLQEIKDWAISRERFWGTPLPVWQCQTSSPIPTSGNPRSGSGERGCGDVRVIGSIKELEKLRGRKIRDLHRPYVDEIIFKCDKCGGIMMRTSEVMDVWFDSGAMPFAQWHYPFENKKIWQQQFPADYIAEAIDQTRGWFYTLLAVSTLLEQGAPYKNVLVVNMVLDAEGKKMSKSRGNVVDPWNIANKYGMDALRWYFFTVNQPSETKQFKEEDVTDRLKKFIFTLSNTYSFFEIYEHSYLEASLPSTWKRGFQVNLTLLDKWIISRFNSVAKDVDRMLAEFEVVKAARIIDDFVVEDVSNWFIRLSRERFRDLEKSKVAVAVLRFLLLEITKLAAPFVPFITERIYLAMNNSSVHLEKFPKANLNLIDQEIEREMVKAKEIVREALRLREEAGIKVRQPLAGLSIKNKQIQDYLDLIAQEVNVKKVIINPKQEEKVILDTKLTAELKEEGIGRDLLRMIQVMRKSAGLEPGEKIYLRWDATEHNREVISKILTDIKDKIAAQEIQEAQKSQEVFLVKKEVEIEEGKVWLGIRKISESVKRKIN